MRPTDAGEIALGTLHLGTRHDQTASYAILDRFVERGGRWLDTANNYACWASPSGTGGASEQMLGSWLQDNAGVRDQVWISTKVGANPTAPGSGSESLEGLGPRAIVDGLEQSLARLKTDHVELYWAHVEDRSVDLAAQVDAFGSLVADGRAGRVGASNHAVWRVERARNLAHARGVEPFSALQLRHTLLQPVSFAPLPEWGHVVATPEALDYVDTEGLGLWSYNTLLGGAYTRDDRLQQPYRHPGTVSRLAALDRVARDLGATRNQVVLAWLLGSSPSVTPIVGVSSVSQLDEVMDARDLRLTSDLRAELVQTGQR